ncbi:hypothetical protein L798_07905 [Zootermopsis nevadensis]|uniref:Uncharacterized protein n=1 Tax=Zootermopsis nevadensis TaxID=136037 RepID=A0A067RVR7_ZOONE|nr:hypothetical protein L798_07905 [Zootermopsis nevadensis]
MEPKDSLPLYPGPNESSPTRYLFKIHFACSISSSYSSATRNNGVMQRNKGKRNRGQRYFFRQSSTTMFIRHSMLRGYCDEEKNPVPAGNPTLVTQQCRFIGSNVL